MPLTGPAVGSTALHNNKDHPVAVGQGVRNFHKIFARHCHLQDDIPSGNACFTHHWQDLLNLPIHVKKAPTWSSSTSMGIQCKVILVLWVPIWSVYILTILVVMMLPASILDSSDTSKMSHIAFDLLTNSLTPMLTLFSTFSIPSLLTPTNFQVFTSDVSREIVLLVIASKAKGIFRSSFSTINTWYFSCTSFFVGGVSHLCWEIDTSWLFQLLRRLHHTGGVPMPAHKKGFNKNTMIMTQKTKRQMCKTVLRNKCGQK